MAELVVKAVFVVVVVVGGAVATWILRVSTVMQRIEDERRDR